MILTARKPDSVGQLLVEEFMEPLALTQQQLADAMGVPRKHVNELCKNRRAVTADTALMLARVFETSPDFWLNLQSSSDIWEAMNDTSRRSRIERAQPVRQDGNDHPRTV